MEVKLRMMGEAVTGSSQPRKQSQHLSPSHDVWKTLSPWAGHKLEVTCLEDEQESYLCLRWCHLPGRVTGGTQT